MAEAKKKLDELKSKMVGEVAIATMPPAAQVTVDGQPQRKSPMTLKLAPGRHKIAVREGYETKEMEVEIGPATSSIKRSSLPRRPPAGHAASRTRGRARHAARRAPGAPAREKEQGASLRDARHRRGRRGGRNIFGIKALSAKSDYDNTPTTDPPTTSSATR